MDVDGQGLRGSALVGSGNGPDEPGGARIHHADGTVTECTLVRDPEDDPEGLTRWFAEPPPGFAIRPGDSLTVDYLPGRCVISVPANLDD